MATRATISGIGIQYEMTGAGPPVLFLNGPDSQASHWAYQRRALESRYRVITFDNRGIGYGDSPVESVHRIAQMADNAVVLLDHLGIERAHVVGSSMGSLVAQEMALRHSERVRSLTLASPRAHSGRLDQIMQPALVLAGAEDTLTPPHLSRALARALPKGRFKRMPGGHSFIAEHADRFNETLLGFLDWQGAASA
jgi:pimeloyl-ACP methyl ester carboxylesterase